MLLGCVVDLFDQGLNLVINCNYQIARSRLHSIASSAVARRIRITKRSIGYASRIGGMRTEALLPWMQVQQYLDFIGIVCRIFSRRHCRCSYFHLLSFGPPSTR
ncbi:hypothetical protein D3C73_1333490 [compost metagenome]